MIPEKIGRSLSAIDTSQLPNESNRTHSLSISENGKVVGTFRYDRLSSAVSLVHELKVLAAIKFTQLEVTAGSADTLRKNSFLRGDKENMPQSRSVSLGQITRILQKHLENSWHVQMPCTLILMTALSGNEPDVQNDTVLFKLISIIEKSKRNQGQLLWYSLGDETLQSKCFEEQKKIVMNTGFCLILPSSGLIKARLLIDEIKKQLSSSEWNYSPVTFCAGVGVKTTTGITEEKLFAEVTAQQKKSMCHNGKIFCFTDTVSSGQVTVDERAQLFKISKKVLL